MSEYGACRGGKLKLKGGAAVGTHLKKRTKKKREHGEEGVIKHGQSSQTIAM